MLTQNSQAGLVADHDAARFGQVCQAVENAAVSDASIAFTAPTAADRILELT